MLPEEEELGRLISQQRELEERLASAELALKSAKAECARFRQRYNRVVGALYAELDELDAAIARARADRDPGDPKLRIDVTAYEERAKTSANEAGSFINHNVLAPEVTPAIKQAYRRAVKLLHPDLALSEGERLRRTGLMTKLNAAYERGALGDIEEIVRDSLEDPEAIDGEGIASQIIKAIRRIAQLRRRLEELEGEFEALKKTDLFELKQMIEDQEAKGGDPLGDLSRDLRSQSSKKREELASAVRA